MKRKFILAGLFACSALTVSAQADMLYAGWHKQWNDSLKGANIYAAQQYLKDHHIKHRKQVIVGILDSGIDPDARVLAPSLWTNPKERADGRDNDRNGYVDDLHGWNFLGTRDGSFDMVSAGTEEYREFKRLYPKYKGVKTADEAADPVEYAYYLKMRKKAGINSYLMFYQMARQKAVVISRMDSMLHATPGVGVDTLTLHTLYQLDMADSTWTASMGSLLSDFMRVEGTMRWTAFKCKQADDLQLMEHRIYGIEHDADKRLLMGDDMNNVDDRLYGNNHLAVDGLEHGTFVASVIGATVGTDSLDGVWRESRLMTVRCSPNGDEYDKDVASALRYAVDNGAKVINVSLGKYTSPRADMVDAALQYTARHDVLVITAGGNNHLMIDSIGYYPRALDTDGQPLSNVIRVGGSAMDGSLSSISNYGQQKIDLYAPGEFIVGFYPGSKVDMANGTSVAAPIVTGIAAMLRSCFPKLKAPQIKTLLMRTVHRRGGLPSVSGGIVDALAALKEAAKK